MSILSECAEYYESYQGEKCSFQKFYSRRVRYKKDSLEKLIQPDYAYAKRKRDYSGPYGESLKKFDELPKPPMNRNKFYQRLTLGYTFEEAIKTGKAFETLVSKKKAKSVSKSPYKSKPKEQIEITPSYIDITYPKDVARVFRKMYNEMIEETELILDELKGNVEEMIATRKRLDNLKDELCVFNYYNK